MLQQSLVGKGLRTVKASRTHSVTHATLGRTPLNKWSTLYLTIQHSQDTDIHAPAGFEPTIPASERPQTRALGRVATGIGYIIILGEKKMLMRL